MTQKVWRIEAFAAGSAPVDRKPPLLVVAPTSIEAIQVAIAEGHLSADTDNQRECLWKYCGGRHYANIGFVPPVTWQTWFFLGWVAITVAIAWVVIREWLKS